MKNTQRSKGIIESVNYDVDHSTVYLYGHFEHIGYTGFGGFCFKNLTDDPLYLAFKREVTALFGVAELEQCVGKECYGLWCRGQNNETMEGIETERGRLTLSGFTRRHCLPENHRDAFRVARESIESTIRWAKRRQTEAEADLAHLHNGLLDGGFIDWETAPPSKFEVSSTFENRGHDGTA